MITEKEAKRFVGVSMILSCHHITKAFVENTVLSDVSFHLEKGEKAAVIGINGAGKSTLLKIITGEMQADSGTVSIARDQKIGYLAQNQNLTSSNSIYQEMLSVRQDVLDMEKEIAESERQMNKVKGDALNALMAR
jgi:ATP-binding cassette subfamily F protein 3